MDTWIYRVYQQSNLQVPLPPHLRDVLEFMKMAKNVFDQLEGTSFGLKTFGSGGVRGRIFKKLNDKVDFVTYP